MKAAILILILIVVAAVGIGLLSAAFIVPEGRQAIITQFGKPVGDPITEPGLHFKTPFIQDVRELDARVLNWTATPIRSRRRTRSTSSWTPRCGGGSPTR